MLALKNLWTAQPPAGTDVVNIHKQFLTIGNANDHGFDQVLKQKLTQSTSAAIRIANHGVALYAPAGTYNVWTANLRAPAKPYPGNTGTVWCLAYCNTPSTTAKTAVQIVANDTRALMEVYFGDGTTDQIGARFTTQGPLTVTYYSGIVPVAGQVYEIFAARNGTVFDLYVDRVKCTTSPSASSALTWSGASKIVVGSRDVASTSLDGGVLAWAASDRYVPFRDIPHRWSLFNARRIYIPTAAAAASSLPILSSPTYVPGSITATGVTGRVTATEA